MLAVTVVTAAAFVLAFAIMVAVSATAMMRMFGRLQLLYLFFSGLAIHENLAAERDVLASQRMVEVYTHVLVAHAYHATNKTVASLIDQRDDGIIMHVGRVEHAVFHEMVLGYVNDQVVAAIAIGIVLANRELEAFAISILRDIFLESVESHSKASVEFHRITLCGFLNQLESVTIINEKLVACFYVPIHKLLCAY